MFATKFLERKCTRLPKFFSQVGFRLWGGAFPGGVKILSKIVLAEDVSGVGARLD